ncbi:MAG TPA: helix-turn-helix transcriptional regulator [Candidatus Xenobia bacterium]|jgi:transcriptional regulator with XRE-family HTH domain
MLSNPQKLARNMRRQRLRCGLSQAKAARLCGVSASWLCQVENGRRCASHRLAERLEPVYGLKSGTFCGKYRFPRRGRHKASPAAGEALRQIMAATNVGAQGHRVTPIPAVPNPHRWPVWQGTVENPLWPVAPHLGQSAQQEVELLEASEPTTTPSGGC